MRLAFLLTLIPKLALASAGWVSQSTGGTGNSSTGADFTVTLPAHEEDDILFMSVLVRDVDDSLTVTGWTQIDTCDRSTIERYFFLWIRATSNAMTNPTVDKSTATGESYAHVSVLRGAISSGDPWAVKGSCTTGTADPSTFTAITPGDNGQLVVLLAMYADDNNTTCTTTGTSPSAYTEHYIEWTTGADAAACTSEFIQTTAATTGTVSSDWGTITAGDGWGGLLMAIRSDNEPDVTRDSLGCSAFSTGNKSVANVAWDSGDTIVVTVAHGAGAGPISHTVSGGTELDWTGAQMVEASAASGAAEAAVWRALAPSSQTGQTISLTLTGGGGGYMCVYVLSGSDSNGAGDTAGNTGTDATLETTGTGAAGVVTASANSYVLCAGNVWTGPVNICATGALCPAITKDNEADDATNATTAFSIHGDWAAGSGNTYGIVVTSSASSDWAFACAEIEPASAAPTCSLSMALTGVGCR